MRLKVSKWLTCSWWIHSCSLIHLVNIVERSSKSPPSWQFVTWFLCQNTFQLYTVLYFHKILNYKRISVLHVTCNIHVNRLSILRLIVFQDGPENNRQTGNPLFHAPVFCWGTTCATFPMSTSRCPCFRSRMAEGIRDLLWLGPWTLFWSTRLFCKDDAHTHTQTGYQMIVELVDHWILFVNAKPNWSSTAWNLDWICLQILNSGSAAVDISDLKTAVVSSLILREGHSVSCWKNR